MSGTYAVLTRKRAIILLIAFVLAICAAIVNVVVGSSGLTAQEFFDAVFNPAAVNQRIYAIVWTMRLPIAAMGLIIGASLACAGAVMQTILNNPLASPYTLGVSAGASVGASLVMVCGLSSLTILGSFALPAAAFVFALLACFGIYIISLRGQFSSAFMILAGIGMVFFFQAIQSALQYFASDEALSGIVFWTFGSLSKANWINISIMICVFLVVFIVFLASSWKLTAMRLGDDKASSMGVDVSRLRKVTFILISLLTATAVSFVGSIGFVGIVAPHIARMIIGEDQRFFLPMSACLGALLLSVASTVSKIILPGVIFPIGIVTSLIGVPFFFFLLLKAGKGGIHA